MTAGSSFAATGFGDADFFGAGTTPAAFLAGTFRAAFARVPFAAFRAETSATFTRAELLAAVLAGAFLAVAGSGTGADLCSARPVFAATGTAFLPAKPGFPFDFASSGPGLDLGSERPPEGRSGFPEDDDRLTASFARVTAAITH